MNSPHIPVRINKQSHQELEQPLNASTQYAWVPILKEKAYEC